MATCSPHGLIQKRGLEEPYQRAKQSINSKGEEIDPKEHFTVHLFEDLFNKQIFPGDDFFINSQQPPSEKYGPHKAYDIVIKYLGQDYSHCILCFAEAERARNKTYAKIRDLETQATEYCREFLDANPTVAFVYACTLVGQCMRCWQMGRNNSEMIGFWDGQRRADFLYYQDVGLDENKDELERAFVLMKSVILYSLRIGQDLSMVGSQLGGQSLQSSEFCLKYVFEATSKCD